MLYTLFSLSLRAEKTRARAYIGQFLGVLPTTSAKLRKILEFLKHYWLKYLVSLVVVVAISPFVFGFAATRALDVPSDQDAVKRDSLAPVVAPAVRDSAVKSAAPLRRQRRSRRVTDTVASPLRDSIAKPVGDSAVISQRRDTTATKSGAMIEQIISGQNTDSLY